VSRGCSRFRTSRPTASGRGPASNAMSMSPHRYDVLRNQVHVRDSTADPGSE
jgi:hypothetical protein